MKKHTLIIGFAFATAFLASCNKTTPNADNQNIEVGETIKSDNPLLNDSELDYYTPDFSVIKDEHFQPALEEAMKRQSDKIQTIANNSEEPTFENTIVALERSGYDLDRVSNVFYALTGANTNDHLKKVQEEISPKTAAHYNAIYLNSDLFNRVETLYKSKDNLKLDSESIKLLENYYEDFKKAGANLSDSDKVELKKINEELASLSTKFNQTLLDANNAAAIKVLDKNELSGLSESEIAALKIDGEEAWEISLLNTTQQPILQSLDNRALREKIFKSSWNRASTGEHGTKETIKKIVELRAQKADLLGFNNYAEWSLQGTMIEEPANIQNFFAGIIPSAVDKAKEESKVIQAMINKSGESFELQPWDWDYYAEKVRKEKYDLNQSEIKPYFELNNVLENGVLYAANKLYGITFKERTDIPVYHEDVKVYELFEEDGSELGLFFTDYYTRSSKRGGAWMSNFVNQSKMYNKKPVIYNVMNISKPAEGEKTLLTYDEVETMFHEFGHALHGFFADQQYQSLSGTSVARDFVEYPSQANEHWALHKDVLSNYAKHYKTGEVIPQSLVQKINNAKNFNQGYGLTEVLAAADLDLNWHLVDSDVKIQDVDAFEIQELSDDNLWLDEVPPRYRSSYFAHIFGGGYGAGYYSYLWTEMLAQDTGNWFEENGGLTSANGKRFRDMILSRGNTLEYDQMYKAFSGRTPEIDAMLKARGLE